MLGGLLCYNRSRVGVRCRNGQHSSPLARHTIAVPCTFLCLYIQVFDLLMDGSELVKKLQTSTKYFRSVLSDAGFTLKVHGVWE